MDEQPSSWEQFEALIDLHKFYFENLIKGGSFSFGFVGAVVVYLLGAQMPEATLRMALTLPLLLCIGSTIIFLLGVLKTTDLQHRVKATQRELGIEWRPHAEILPLMSGAFALLFLLTIAGIIWAMIDPGIVIVQ